MNTKNGGFTLPAEAGMEKEIARLATLWNVDAVRDSDGTELSQEILDMGFKIYSTLCLVREDNEWAKEHRDCLQQVYLLSDRITAHEQAVSIPIMASYFAEQCTPDTDHDITKYWEVIDRSSGEILSPSQWIYDQTTYTVHISNAKRWHVYTVGFLAWQIWEPTSMYNHITNGWTSEHKLPLDVRAPKARTHMLSVLEEWLKAHPKTDIVRFTTFFYQFDLIYNNKGKEKRVDWFGYGSTVSAYALEEFEKTYGYRLRSEDFVDAGQYNTPFKNPSKRFLDWMEFNQKFVSQAAKELVDMVHRYGKKAIMFLGDHWAGTEPYGTYFQSIGLDAVVGAAGDGVTTRMIADIPVKETEARFYPYFFPDTFYKGGDPVGASMPIWKKCRRALMRSPVQRMGYGGYLSLAVQFPDFIDHVTDICRQCNLIRKNAFNADGSKAKPYTAAFKVAVLTSWGKLRTWQTHQVAHSLWNQRCYSYLGAIESLAGFPFEIEFMCFDDICNTGIPSDVGVIVNAGDAGTAWCGGDNWKNECVTSILKEWVASGGGFIGIGEPTACEDAGLFFQMEDVLGVQKEIGFTVSTNKPTLSANRNHFVCRDIPTHIDYGEGTTMIYPTTASVHDVQNGSVCLATNTFSGGRSVYFAGLPYNDDNARLLLRSLYWAAGKESDIQYWFSSNPKIECHAYPASNTFALVNNSMSDEESLVTLGSGEIRRITIKAMDTVWSDIT